MKPMLLCILDGVGIREEIHGNAVYKANMPYFKDLLNNYSHSLLEASGHLVGLPDEQMGNSEVGHMNIGAGRIVYQPLQLINELINNKEFFQNKELIEIMNYTKNNNSTLHIMGLLSDGGIHSHINHLKALIDMCKENGIEKLYIHAILDGRDTLPEVSLQYLDELNNKLEQTNIGKIATISGRYYTMDRDNRWDRVELSYNAIVRGIGRKASNYKEAIIEQFNEKITDEFIIPTIIDKEGTIKQNDGVIVFNFRPDRLREICSALTNPKFSGFKKEDINTKMVTFLPVSDEVITKNAFKLDTLENTFGEYISNLGLNQLRIAETEKYAHVTYFFDGGIEKELKGCTRILIPSPKVATYDLKPEMSAYEVTDTLLKELDKDIHDVIILNFANGDMVGHTGDFNATVKALENIDICLGKIVNKVNEKEGTMIVIADHGNSDYMLDDNNNIITSHSMSKVPFIINKKGYKLQNGKLADVIPTMLYLMKKEIPKEMTGNVLITEETN